MNKKLRYLVIFICLIFSILLFANQSVIQAKDLEFNASKVEGGVIIRTFSVASYRTQNAFWRTKKPLGTFIERRY